MPARGAASVIRAQAADALVASSGPPALVEAWSCLPSTSSRRQAATETAAGGATSLVPRVGAGRPRAEAVGVGLGMGRVLWWGLVRVHARQLLGPRPSPDIS